MADGDMHGHETFTVDGDMLGVDMFAAAAAVDPPIDPSGGGHFQKAKFRADAFTKADFNKAGFYQRDA